MKKNILKTALIPIILSGIAFSATSCTPWRNNYAYDLDFEVDVSGTTIEFWTGFGTDINDALDDFLDEFEHLTGVHVAHESKGGYDNLLSAIQLAATTGGFPHIAIGYPDHFATYVKQNIIVRLDYYFENDVTNDFEGEEKFAITDFYQDYMRENQEIEFKDDETPWTLGVPFNKSTEVMVYNSTFFDWCAGGVGQATLNNLGIGAITVPTTYAELDSVSKNILALLDNVPSATPGGAPGVYNKYLMPDGKAYAHNALGSYAVENAILNLHNIFKWGTDGRSPKDTFKPFSYDSQSNLFITTVRQFGGQYTYFDKVDKHGYVSFNSEETKNGLRALKTMYDDNTFGIPADWDEAKYGSNPFKANKTVMTLGSSAGVANSAPTGNRFQIKAAPVPYHAADKKFVISQGANLALLDKGSREQRVASWMLLKFLSKYANGALCAQTGYYPASPFAEEGGMWVGGESESFDDYVTWLQNAKVGSSAEKIKAQTAQVNLDYYVNADEHWTKFVDTPFAGSADIRNEVASGPGWVFYEQKGTKGNVESVIKASLDALYERLKDYVKN